MNRSRLRLLPALLIAVATPGCLSLSNEGPIVIERMDPVADLLEVFDGSTPDHEGAMELIVRPTTAGPQISELLRVRMATGLTDYSDTMRWDQLPARVLDVGLTNGLAEKPGWARSAPGGSVTLQVELQRFDVDLVGESPRFVMDAVWTLRSGAAGGVGKVHNGRFATQEPLTDRSAGSISAAATTAIRKLIQAIPGSWPGS